MSATPLAYAALTGAFLVGFAGSAFALDGKDFARTLNSGVSAFGWNITYSAADVSGSTVVLQDAVLKAASGESFSAGDLTFSGVEETADGGYTAQKLAVPDVKVAKDGNQLLVSQIEIGGLDIPPVSSQEGKAPIVTARQASIGTIHAAGPQGDVFNASGTTFQLDTKDGGKHYTSSADIAEMTLYPGHSKDPETQKVVEALGYQTVTGRFAMQGSWDTGSGTVAVSQCTLAFDNIGKLSFTEKLGGYTPEVIDSLRQMAEKFQANPHDKATQQALGIGMLGLTQQLSFAGASLSFDDDSVTSKVLAYLGKQQGLSAEQMAAAATAMLPMALARLNNEKFEQQIADAVGKFLKDPQNISIAAAPDKPVPFPMIVGAVAAAPQTLPDVLGLTVTANQ